MDRDKMPDVSFTKDELRYLQDLMSKDRAAWFNYYEVLVEQGDVDKATEAHQEYMMCKTLRDKLYHMTGRDTLAPGNHAQRWWDQGHDYR